MSWTQISCQYDGTYPGFLSCVFDCYVNREEPVEFRTPEDMCCSLYPLRTVETDEAHAQRVYRSFAGKLGREGRELAVRGFLTCLPDKELALLTLIRRGLREGDRVRLDLSDPVMARVNLALAKMWTEWDHLKGFVRFSDLDGVLVGEIEPKNRVLPLLAGHFAARYSGEQIVL